MEVWIVMREENVPEDHTPLSVWATKEQAEAERDHLIGLAVSEGVQVYWDPNDPDHDDDGNWEVDFNVEGPFFVEVS